jgi:Ser/Thr protein kinase RdoA (MazF antagonist)
MELTEIADKFGIVDYSIEPFGSGLINNTWVVEAKKPAEKFILQRINTNVFKKPGDIAYNIRLIADHLQKYHPEYLFIRPVKTTEGEDLLQIPEGSFRMFPYVTNSHTIDVVQTPGQAYEAAREFGKFTRVLGKLDCSLLKITLPHFHDLSLRFHQFENAIQHGNKDRIVQCRELIEFIFEQKNLVDEFENIKRDKGFKIRVTHHDTKISNVLFDENEKSICVIDLDTVMPGYFISDVGDMMRTYLSPAGEEEKDYSKITARQDFFQAITEGYNSEMKDELTGREKEYFLYAGKFMIYMQAIRFLADHLNNDIYYGAKYEGHNLIRAGNQVELLKQLSK